MAFAPTELRPFLVPFDSTCTRATLPSSCGTEEDFFRVVRDSSFHSSTSSPAIIEIFACANIQPRLSCMPEAAGWSNHDQFDVGDWSDHHPRTEIREPTQQAKNKNGKNKNDKNSSVETRYEGFYLERAEPLAGERPSWARVGRRTMPFDDAKLAEISRKHRVYRNIGPAKAFSALSSSQQGVVGRLIADRQANEKNKDAEWVLEYVKPTIEKDYWKRVTRCTKIAVIIRRQQRNGSSKDAQGYAKGTTTYAAGEIIDLADPLPQKREEKGDKKAKKHSKQQDIHDIDDIGPMSDPFASLGRDHIIDVPPNMPGQGGHHGNQQHPPMQAFGPPPGAIPVDAPFPPPIFPHEQHPRPHSGHGANPFQPHREFDTPDLYEEHRGGFGPDFGRNPRLQARTPVHIEDEGRRSRSRARSASRRRDEDFRRQQQLEREIEDQREEDRQQREEDRRQQRANQRRIETKMDELGARFEDLEVQNTHNKVNAWHNRDSSSEESYRERRDRRDFWGDDDTRASFTPPSSPGRSEIYPSGSLGGRRPIKEYRDIRGYPQERRRSAGYRDTQTFIEPHRNRRNNIDLPPRAPSPGRYMRRPPLIHAATFDDYPREPVAQRLLPEFENQEFPRAQFGGGRDRDRRRGDRVYDRVTRRNTVDYSRPRRNDDGFAERGGMRRDQIFR
ncbi:uncharacterized protein MYCFIDRAFT_171826 [Pseudocercospora fijiensis CIRAD86]|uniref:Uncharacterized protein n=1 Tax=Pseudocercospora fijiensis (strain CIRAD86) TaxID=383855 RepID=M3AN18_PSEFD|nr:uncharacterized protein MYCFIDRAFT_171826 [Pseudocercospora fijiensis CIRAD86]EME85996.1 hypothetical protein MYCFIDRAFT_171826 [Pseudocercospora fijiensis CIRAD86]